MRLFIMKIQLLILTGLLNQIPTYGRLIQKNKTRIIEITQSEKPNPSIRLTRDTRVLFTRTSQEDYDQSGEVIKSSFKTQNLKTKPKTTKPTIRKAQKKRDSKKQKKLDLKSNQLKGEPKKLNNTKTVLVKKPIPKFQDKDYGDFQSKVSNINIIADSGDHEDDDFNLEDYDFDINHDEYASGRKPLEPRTNIKNTESDTKIHESKIASRVVVQTIKTVSNKKQRSAELETPNKSKGFDYYDDLTTKSPENVTKAKDDEYTYGDDDDSKELDRTKSLSRKARSWNINLFENRYTNNMQNIVSQVMGVLPLFPQVQNYASKEDYYEITDFNIDPLTGRRFIM